jgi:hypothetical protein
MQHLILVVNCPESFQDWDTGNPWFPLFWFYIFLISVDNLISFKFRFFSHLLQM